MKSVFTSVLFALALTAAVAVAHPARAHNLWLNATEYAPNFSTRTGAHTKVYFGFGHRFPVQDFLEADKLAAFKLVAASGDESALTPGPGGFLATPVILKKEGGYTVAAATQHGYYTMYRKEDRMHHKLGSMEGLDDVVLSLYFENYCKALISVGKPDPAAFAAPVGHGIEIVPLENPYLKNVGDRLPLRVLHNGRPAPFCSVSATYVGFSTDEDYAFSNKTDGRGETHIRLIHPGQWIVLAVVRQPAPESEKGKCLEMKYSATMSFAVP
jgi:uncharacterized GH25 family protein